MIVKWLIVADYNSLYKQPYPQILWKTADAGCSRIELNSPSVQKEARDTQPRDIVQKPKERCPVIRFVIVGLLALLSLPSSVLSQSCAANPVSVQILGSGGPRINPDRASSAISSGSALKQGFLLTWAVALSFDLARAKRSLATCP
jgi:hypothetical protein